MHFLDAAFPQSVPQMVAALQHEQAGGFAYYIGGNFALHAWDVATVDGVRTAGFPGLGIYVSTVVGRSGAADGQDAARLQAVYGADRFCCWDLEPGVYRANPDLALRYGVEWSAVVAAAGFLPVLYSTPDGCAAIGDKGFHAVWAAVPGNCDPTSIFNPAFFPGLVAVQCGAGSWDGVDYDVNVSEFDFGVLEPPVITPEPPRDVMPAEIAFPARLVLPFGG